MEVIIPQSADPSAINGSSPPSSINHRSKFNRNVLFAVPFVALTIIGIGLLIFRDKYLEYQKAKTLQSEDLIITPVPSANGWLTYTSQKANFTVSYPQNWPLTKLPIRENCGKPCVERLVFAPPFDITKQDKENLYLPEKKYAFINVLDTAYFPVYKSFDEKDRSINRDKQVASVKYLTIGGERAISYKYVGLNPQVIRKYWTVKNGFQYDFTLYHNSDYPDEEEYIKTFEGILATFKFNR